MDDGSVIVTNTVSAQPAESVTIQEYVPANKLVAVVVVCALASSHKHVYKPAPPVEDAVAEPSLPP